MVVCFALWRNFRLMCFGRKTRFILNLRVQCRKIQCYSLVAHFDVLPRYWTSEATSEVDFLLQNNTSLLPIEVKSGTRLNGKSLGVYINRFDTELALRYSMNNLKRDDVILNIPIFLADWTEKLLIH